MTHKSDQRKSAYDTMSEPESGSTSRYRIISAILIERLRKQDITWIRISDTDGAGGFQLSTNLRVDAYKIQWSEWPDSLTLNDLTDDTTDDACLIRQLADGWLSLKAQHEVPVTVHLVTNDQASAKKLALTDSNNGHLAKFLATEWKQVLMSDEWAPVWSCVQGASALDDRNFRNFVEHCRFACSFTVPEHDEDDDEHQPFFWINQLEQYFSRSVTAPYLELSQGELLQVLGWRSEDAKSFLNPLHAVSTTIRDDDQTMNALRRTKETSRRTNTEPAEPSPDISPPEIVKSRQLEAAPSESDPGTWLRTTAPEEESQRSVFTGSKDGAAGSREKRSWKDLAEKEKQSPLTKRFSEGTTRDTSENASVKSTSRLRQLLRSQYTQPDEAEDSESFGAGGGDFTTGVTTSNTSVDPQIETGDFPQAADWLSQKARWVPDEGKDSTKGKHTDTQNETGEFPQTAAWPVQPTSAPGEDAQDTPTSIADPSTVDRAKSQDSPLSDSNPDPVETISSDAPPESSCESEQSSTSDAETADQRPTQVAVSAAESSEPNEDEDISDLDNFARVSRLAKRQDGIDTNDESANRDAFDWYFKNGNELFTEGRFADAAPEYIRALEIFGTLDTPSADEEYVILHNLGEIYIFLDKPDLTVELYERTKEKRFTTKIPSTKYITALMKLGAGYEERNQFDDAEIAFRKAVEVAAATLEKNDPLIESLNEACLQLARNRSTLMSRFSTTEVDKIRDMAKQEAEVAIIYRKKKTTEADVEAMDIWKSSKKNEEEEKPPPVSAKKKWTIASLVVAVAFVFAYAILVPRSGVNLRTTGVPEASKTAASAVVSYTSCDDRKEIRLANGDRATIKTDGKIEEGAYRFVKGNIQDLIAMIPGHMRHDFVFLRANNDAIIDQNGTTLYANYAPEHQLVSSMWRYGALAQGYRVEKSFYPEKIEDLAISKEATTYTNPFNHRTDTAIIYGTTGESTDTPVRDVIARGEGWEKQPPGAPGKIVCNTYNGRLFFIRGYDRDGKLLTSAEPGKCFFIECADGIDLTKEKLKEIQNTPPPENTEATKIQRKLQYVLSPSDEAESTFSTLRCFVPVTLFALVLMAFFSWRYRVVKKVAGPFSVAIFILTAVLLLAWYVVALVDVGV